MLPDSVTAPQAESVLIIACGALAREINQLKQLNGWSHVKLQCLEADLHNRPDWIPGKLREAIAKYRDQYEQIFIGYADCGTGGEIDRIIGEEGLERLPGAHCYAFFDGVQAFEDRAEVTSFFLTDFLVRQFDSFVWKPLGLDRHPELLPMYFGNYEALVYLAQTDDPELVELARSYAARMGLRFEHRQTGYGDLETTLQGWAKT